MNFCLYSLWRIRNHQWSCPKLSLCLCLGLFHRWCLLFLFSFYYEKNNNEQIKVFEKQNMMKFQLRNAEEEKTENENKENAKVWVRKHYHIASKLSSIIMIISLDSFWNISSFRRQENNSSWKVREFPLRGIKLPLTCTRIIASPSFLLPTQLQQQEITSISSASSSAALSYLNSTQLTSYPHLIWSKTLLFFDL